MPHTLHLPNMCLSAGHDIAAIANYLDGLDHERRWAEVSALGAREQRELFDKAALAPPLSLGHFVPATTAKGSPVPHLGRNTFPNVALNHRFFSKVFCRTEDDPDEVYGFNDAPSRALIGPGYFVTIPTDDNPGWRHRGAVVIDYTRVPAGVTLPSTWPRVRANSFGLQHFVYHRTRDFMRRVSSHVSIGAAYKDGLPLDMYFVLCRPE